MDRNFIYVSTIGSGLANTHNKFAIFLDYCGGLGVELPAIGQTSLIVSK